MDVITQFAVLFNMNEMEIFYLKKTNQIKKEYINEDIT